MDSMHQSSGIDIDKKRMWLALLPAIVIVVLIGLAFLMSRVEGLSLGIFQQGILPREVRGLPGIVFSPFVHSSVSHLFSNLLPLLLLIGFLFYFYNKIAFRSLLSLWLLSGFFTWLIGRQAYHVGASGLVFALVFFLFFSGLFRKYIPLVAVSMVIAFIYGSMVWSMFPFAEYVDADLSWEGHLSGAFAGLIIAFVFRRHGPQKPPVEWEEEEDENEEEVNPEH
ncbi:MAG TPA: rhomboid family intramembrane serine protease [Porphyromonadaceae bacterium]|uniref:rhomboid family intramembrane serine protease n=1 Tax=Limibacterium fermenti TaxID=3229863 RepID=UPI000E97AF73|nr:rhomboid family intramembrane serine protease [Porphyromonadaceae bacterium]HBL33359.1 rhomboid family intramembrane serine protease [Porphyromonadaceae bacterium]HBX20495.1 rhomboid family intramembrane serine protease [Porphyromonadaceae bacterium]HBX44353.1 rhomboid family intramembrane serine protease [Porphyromonadaceae bacterium]